LKKAEYRWWDGENWTGDLSGEVDAESTAPVRERRSRVPVVVGGAVVLLAVGLGLFLAGRSTGDGSAVVSSSTTSSADKGAAPAATDAPTTLRSSVEVEYCWAGTLGAMGNLTLTKPDGTDLHQGLVPSSEELGCTGPLPYPSGLPVHMTITAESGGIPALGQDRVTSRRITCAIRVDGVTASTNTDIDEQAVAECSATT
jgi:hypothetical protein